MTDKELLTTWMEIAGGLSQQEAAAACGCKVSEPDGRLLKIKNIPKNI